MPVTWLHISDFHIRTGDPYDRNVVLQALVSSVRRFRGRGRAPDVIFATGDIAFSGKEAEYALATEFFDQLLDAAGLPRERLFVIPGNHDVDREGGIGLARTLATREEADAYFNAARPKIHLVQKLGAFVAWHNGYFRGIRSAPTNTTCGPVEVIEINGMKLGILPISSALFCLDDDDHAKLFVGRRALAQALDELRSLHTDLNVTLIHHPLEWLSEIEESNISATLQANVDVLLRGHLHKSDIESTVSATGGFVHVAAGAAYQTRKWPNRALYGTFDGRAVTIFPIRYEDEPLEVWVVDPSVFPEDAGHERAFVIPRLANAPAATGAPASPIPAPSPPAPQAAAPQFRSNIAARYNLPFVGRDDLLREMSEALADTSSEANVILHGQPGVGKSELAREYARRNKQRYPGGTFLIRAGSGGEAVDLAHIGAVQLSLEFPEGFSIQDQAERTLLSLGGAPVLLIYDNVTSEANMGPWLPPAGIPCHVVATTNNERWSPRWRLLKVEPLPNDQAMHLVEQVGGEEVARRVGEELVRISEGLPAQLVPAAVALAYENRRGRLDAARPSMAPEVHDSFRVPYESLGDPERLLLHSAAHLNPQRIIRSVLSETLAEGAGWSEGEFRGRLDACLDLHLLEGGEELRMHQLFATFLQSLPLPPALTEAVRDVRVAQRNRLLEVASALEDNPARADVATLLNGFRVKPEDWRGEHVELNVKDGETVGGALYQIGKYEDAQPWFERAVKEKQEGDMHGRVDHESLGISLHTVGCCLSRVGKYEMARSWFERAVEEARQGDVRGRVDHQSLGSSLIELGNCLSSVGKYEEARGWFERAVEEVQQGDVHGRVDHERLSGSLHMVGFCLSSVGKHADALPWCKRAVEETQQGDMQGRVDHESLGSSLHEVGYCLSSLGKYAEARRWYERAAREAQQGDVYGRVDHASVGKSLHQAGYCLVSIGEYGEALQRYEQAIEAKRRGDMFGRVDTSNLSLSMSALAGCLRELGREQEAQQWTDEAARLLGID